MEENHQTSGINRTEDSSEIGKKSEGQKDAINELREVKYSDPDVPISTAKDEKASFTNKQKIFIKDLKKITKKLELSIKVEIEVSRQNEKIKGDIIALSEKLVKSRDKDEIESRVNELRNLHSKLNGGVLKIEKEKALIQGCNLKLYKLKSDIPF